MGEGRKQEEGEIKCARVRGQTKLETFSLLPREKEKGKRVA